MHVLSATDLGHDVDAPTGVRTLFDGLAFGLSTDDAVAVVGPNGSGKSTMLAVLDQALPPQRGTVEWGPTVERAVYHQQAAVAPSDQRVIGTVTAIAPRIPLADGTTLAAGADVARARELHLELEQVRAELEDVEDAWLEATT